MPPCGLILKPILIQPEEEEEEEKVPHEVQNDISDCIMNRFREKEREEEPKGGFIERIYELGQMGRFAQLNQDPMSLPVSNKSPKGGRLFNDQLK